MPPSWVVDDADLAPVARPRPLAGVVGLLQKLAFSVSMLARDLAEVTDELALPVGVVLGASQADRIRLTGSRNRRAARRVLPLRRADRSGDACGGGERPDLGRARSTDRRHETASYRETGARRPRQRPRLSRHATGRHSLRKTKGPSTRCMETNHRAQQGARRRRARARPGNKSPAMPSSDALMTNVAYCAPILTRCFRTNSNKPRTTSPKSTPVP